MRGIGHRTIGTRALFWTFILCRSNKGALSLLRLRTYYAGGSSGRRLWDRTGRLPDDNNSGALSRLFVAARRRVGWRAAEESELLSCLRRSFLVSRMVRDRSWGCERARPGPFRRSDDELLLAILALRRGGMGVGSSCGGGGGRMCLFLTLTILLLMFFGVFRLQTCTELVLSVRVVGGCGGVHRRRIGHPASRR